MNFTLQQSASLKSGSLAGENAWIVTLDDRVIDDRDEPPAELVEWRKLLNSQPIDQSPQFGVVDRSATRNQYCPTRMPARWISIDQRGRWVIATGLGRGCDRPLALSTEAAWELAPQMAVLLDEFYGGESTRPVPPKPESVKEPTAAEKLQKLRDDLISQIGNSIVDASIRRGSATSRAAGETIVLAIERLIDARLSLH